MTDIPCQQRQHFAIQYTKFLGTILYFHTHIPLYIAFKRNWSGGLNTHSTLHNSTIIISSWLTKMEPGGQVADGVFGGNVAIGFVCWQPVFEELLQHLQPSSCTRCGPLHLLHVTVDLKTLVSCFPIHRLQEKYNIYKKCMLYGA